MHVFLSVAPQLSMSQVVQSFKGKTSRKLMMEYKGLSRAIRGHYIWTRGYFVASFGNVTDEVIMKYIEEQGKEPPDGDFSIEDGL
jgi:putative transposase